MKIKMKTILISGYSIITVILILSFAYAIFQMNKIDKEVSGSIAVEAVKSEIIEMIQFSLAEIELASVIITDTMDGEKYENSIKTLTKAKNDIDANILKLDRVLTSAEVIVLFDEFKANWSLFKAIDYGTFGKSSFDEDHQFELMDKLRSTLNELQILKRDQMMASIASTKANTNSTKRTRMFMMFIAFAIAVIVSIAVIRLMQRKIGGEPDFVNSAALQIRRRFES